jgi:hypothetical protein
MPRRRVSIAQKLAPPLTGGDVVVVVGGAGCGDEGGDEGGDDGGGEVTGARVGGVVLGDVSPPDVGAVDGVTGTTEPEGACVVEVELDPLDELPAAPAVEADVDAGIPFFRTANHACATFWPWA